MQLAAPRLLGRDSVLTTLHEALRGVALGTGGCILIEGPAGIGKSSILRVAAHYPGVMVAAGIANQVDQWSPLTSVLSALGHVEGLDLAFDMHIDDRSAANAQISRMVGDLEQIAVRQPLVVILDDLHWADEFSLRALRILIPALSSFPVLWLLATRPMPTRHQPADALVTWLLPKQARLLRLTPLSDSDIAEFCMTLLGAPLSEALLSQVLRAGGNPFLVQELLAMLVRDGAVSIIEGEARLATTQLPTGFLQSVECRLGDMSERARQLLEAGAIFGRPFSIHEAAALTGQVPLDLISATTEVLQSGALVDDGGELSFRHDLIREVVYDALPRPVRLALHREAVTVLQREGRTALEIVEHLLRGGRITDSRSEVVLRDAVRQMAATAPGSAAGLVVRWLQLVNKQDTRYKALTALAVQLLAAAGRIEEATSLGEDALGAGIDAVAEAELRLGLCQALKHAGQDEAVTEHARNALLRTGVPEALRAQLLAVQAHGLLSSDNWMTAEEVGATAAELGRSSGHYGAYVFATVARSCVARMRGESELALEFAREAVATADDRGGDAGHWHPRLWLARALGSRDRLGEADAILELEERESERMGTPWSQPVWHYYRAELLLAIGRVDDAEAEAESGVRIAEQIDALALDVPLHALRCQISLYRADLDSARSYITRAEQLVTAGVGVAQCTVAWPRALIEDADGHEEALASCLDQMFSGLPTQSQLLIQERRAAAQLVHWALRFKDHASAELVVAASQKLADSNPTVASFRAAALHAEGVCRGELDLLLRSAAEYQRCPRPLDRAAALEDAGRLAIESGDSDLGMALLREAYAHYDLSNCARDTSRIQLSLSSQPYARAEPRPVRREPTVLTSSEVRVVELVIQGLTNREVAARLYLSPHTVDSHLRHSFTKLGLRSRVELTREVFRHPELLRIP